MKILFTGTSSFTGFWFIQELVKNGHEVYAVCRKKLEDYEGIRRVRLEKLGALCEIRFECEFGSPQFLDWIDSEQSWDLLCHHGSETAHYKSPEFDCMGALASNTKNAALVMKKLGCCKILLTGTVFEPSEGGDTSAASLYGLSKGLTYQVFKHQAEVHQVKLAKFVIPNPFGPYEELRFTSFLAKSWLEGKVPMIKTPAYVRDNIHVDLLAKAYRNFAEQGNGIFRPSGYVETQGKFAKRFSREMEKRLCIPCPLEIKEQVDFSEPMSRINSDKPNILWDEEKAWDSLAEYYANPLFVVL